MYDIIYDFLETNIFNGNVPSMSFSIGGASIGLNEWLTHTACIIIMCIAIFLMIMLVRWVFRLVSSAFLLK